MSTNHATNSAANKVTATAELPDRLTYRKACLTLMDVANSLKVARELGDSKMFALFIDDFYTLTSRNVREQGGEIIKFIGDSSLAIFDEDAVENAIESIKATRDAFPEMCERYAFSPTDVLGVVHIGDVIFGEFGPECQKDVIGSAANKIFQTRGSGITISEQAYRKLPSDARTPWKKKGGDVRYEHK